MCQFHPVGTYHCDKRFWPDIDSDPRNYTSCSGSITCPPGLTMEEEWRYITNAGWLVCAMTGTGVYCSEEHAGWYSQYAVKFSVEP